MVEKRDPSVPAPAEVVPELPAAVPVADLPVPDALNLSRFANLRWATGGACLWGDYQVGERIVHHGGMTLEESDHTMATRLYQNNARVHFDQHAQASTR